MLCSYWAIIIYSLWIWGNDVSFATEKIRCFSTYFTIEKSNVENARELRILINKILMEYLQVIFIDFFLDCDEIFYDVVWQSQHPESYLSGGCDNTDFHFLPNWWLNPGSEWPKLDNVTLEIILIYSLSSFLIMVNSWLHPLHWAKRRGDVKGMTAAGPRMRKHQHPVRVSEGKCELQAVKQKANQIMGITWSLFYH